MRTALYARTSTDNQNPLSQLLAMRDYAERRGWSVVLEYTDDGVSGATGSRQSLDLLRRDAKRGRFEAVLVWRLDRLGRSLRHLVLLLDEFDSAGVTFASVNDGIDLSTAGGRFQAGVLAALAEYERIIIGDRVRIGQARARSEGVRIGRPRASVTPAQLEAVAELSLSEAAAALRVSRESIRIWRRDGIDKKFLETADRKR